MQLALSAGATDVRPAPPTRSAGLRRPFVPSPPLGPYRLPTAVRERLSGLLAPFRNRDAAFALAVMLARFWTAPARLERAFPVDRRALAGHDAHGLTEARVRGALRVLEEIGFLDREEPPAGTRYQRTAEGLHRRPITFRFGPDFLPAFRTANARARAARGGRDGAPRTSTTAEPSRASTGILAAQPLNSPKGTASEGTGVIMGEVVKGFPERRMAEPIAAGSALATALARLAAGVFAPGCKPPITGDKQSPEGGR